MDVQIGKGIMLAVDVQKLGENIAVRDHIIYIGLRNILMDAHAGITTDEPDYQDKARAVAEKKLEAMYNGEVRVAGTREGDPVRAEAKRLAVAMIHAQAKKAGRKLSSLDKAKVNEAANGLITPELLARAAERVAEAKALAGDVDVSGL
jgi:hypothetical protein